jgi:hypothetical protein
MKMLGRAVSDIRSTSPVCIGIMPWQTVNGVEELQSKVQGKRCKAEYRKQPKSPGDHNTGIDPNHNYFLFIDHPGKITMLVSLHRWPANSRPFAPAEFAKANGGQSWGAENGFRGQFEKFITEKWSSIQDSVEERDKIETMRPPLLQIAIGGGAGTLATLMTSVKSKNCTIVIAGSGGFAGTC